MKKLKSILPGSTIGIMGEGQLGMMLAMKAIEMNYTVIIYGDKEEGCAYAHCSEKIVAPYTDKQKLAEFARLVDVILLEFENIPAESLVFLKKFKPVCPGASVLQVTQDRWFEKMLCYRNGIKTAKTSRIISEKSIKRLTRSDFPGRLKTRRFGYDGHGQVAVNSKQELLAAWQSMQSNGETPCIYERHVDFAAEYSVIVARNASGEKVSLPVVKNEHENGILRTTKYYLRREGNDTLFTMKDIAWRLADKLNVVGLLAVEFFLGRDDKGFLVNEMAPRPHNSGHWSMDACDISQYEMYIRAACNLPMIVPTPHSSAIMTNLLGDEVYDLDTYQSEEFNIHVYGKKETKPGRKMGHVTKLF